LPLDPPLDEIGAVMIAALAASRGVLALPLEFLLLRCLFVLGLALQILSPEFLRSDVGPAPVPVHQALHGRCVRELGIPSFVIGTRRVPLDLFEILDLDAQPDVFDLKPAFRVPQILKLDVLDGGLAGAIRADVVRAPGGGVFALTSSPLLAWSASLRCSSGGSFASASSSSP